MLGNTDNFAIGEPPQETFHREYMYLITVSITITFLQYVITILGNDGKGSACMVEIKWNFRLIKIIDCIDELWCVIYMYAVIYY